MGVIFVEIVTTIVTKVRIKNIDNHVTLLLVWFSPGNARGGGGDVVGERKCETKTSLSLNRL